MATVVGTHDFAYGEPRRRPGKYRCRQLPESEGQPPKNGEINGIAFSPDGMLYGIGFSLYTINVDTGVATRVTPARQQVSGGFFNDLDMGVDGQLRAVELGTSSTSSKLYVIDPRTGLGQLVGLMGGNMNGLASRRSAAP